MTTIRLLPKSEHKFDIERSDFYKYKEDKSTTWARLKQIADLGMEEVGTAEFGVRGIVSGLYIERIWDMTDAAWIEHVSWMTGLIFNEEPEKCICGQKSSDQCLEHCDKLKKRF